MAALLLKYCYRVSIFFLLQTDDTATVQCFDVVTFLLCAFDYTGAIIF